MAFMFVVAGLFIAVILFLHGSLHWIVYRFQCDFPPFLISKAVFFPLIIVIFTRIYTDEQHKY